MTVLAIDTWPSNAELIADCARLGYLRSDWLTLDATHGVGTFWRAWRPEHLVRCDLHPAKATDLRCDFTALPFADEAVPQVVFDPPYKLNGTPDPITDDRYGVANATPWQERMELIVRGTTECARVLGSGHLLVKCQDQVCSGRVRWQTYDVTSAALEAGLRLVDRFDFISYRPQPNGRRQVHARRNASQLLVFTRA